MYNSATTIHQGVKANTGGKVVEAKLALHWTGPYNVLAVGPSSSAEIPDGSPLGENFTYLDLPSDRPGLDACRCVAIERCKSCADHHDSSDMPTYLPAGLTQNMLDNIFQEFPSVPRHSRRRFGPPPTTRGREDHRSRDEVASSRCYTRRIGGDSPNHPGSAKWTSTSPATTFCVIGPALQTSTPNPTAFTTPCGLVRHSMSFPRKTKKVF